ncbi:transcription factor bHLH118-like [Silene latifolia]|uniref:transcription factor bHLH118-like n=1 Tax=Silene latifolia TaxID=37657 RepID=UPI003D7797CA
MFPNQRTNMLSFQTSDNNGDQNDDNNVQDQIWSEYGGALDRVGASNPSNNSRKSGRGRGRKSSGSSTAINNVSADDDQQKKLMHREIERQRRKEMSDLCASLRSALPTEYIKGKRSTSDHLAEAVNYIKDLEKNVKELGEKRDKVKASIGSTSSKEKGGVGGSSNSTPSPGTVVLVPRLGGLDIEINVWYENQVFSLSTALHVIHEEGLGIASYTSTKIDDRLVHNIVCEVGDMACIDIDRLHQRLIFLVY